MDYLTALKILKAISDKNRLTIVLLLERDGETCACRLLQELDCGQPTLSHHMKILVECGLVKMRKDWKWAHYSLDMVLLSELTAFLKGNTK